MLTLLLVHLLWIQKICILQKTNTYIVNCSIHLCTTKTKSYYLDFVDVGINPGQEFTAVIHATSPLVSQSQPIMKLLQVVSKSKYCSQVLQSYIRIKSGSIQ